MKNIKTFSLRLVLGALAVSTVLPVSALANCGADLSTQFHIQLGRQYTSNGVTHQPANITNLGGTSKGPFYFVVSNLPAGVGETPFTWTSACEPGSLFIRIYLGYDNQWVGGATRTLMLNFLGAKTLPFSYNYRIVDGSVLPNPRVVPGDYDGDRIADLTMFDQTTGNWTIKQSSDTQVSARQYGVPNIDRFVVGDFDGDLKEDLALYRPSMGLWFISRSSDGVSMSFALGVPNVDIPVPADYDGDGYTDIAVYNPTTVSFKVRLSTTGQIITKQFGAAGDIPVPGQFDGDGKADFAVFRPANFTFYILKSHTNQLYWLTAPGFKSGVPFAADFNGDGLDDMNTYNPTTGTVSIMYTPWGGAPATGNTVSMGANSKPVVADFTGDAQADMATYWPVTAHWALDSQMNNPGLVPVLSFAFGTPPNDMPVMTIPASIW